MTDDPRDAPPFRTIARHFPSQPAISLPVERQALWRLGRQWGGYPELEWCFALFPDRALALSGTRPAFFYEQLSEFSTARFLVRLNTILRARDVRSFPSVTIGFTYFDSAYYVTDGRLTLPTAGDPFRGRHYAMTADGESDTELAFWGWSQSWGDHGRGYISEEYFDAYVDNVMARWYAVGGPSRAFERCLRSTSARKRPRNERMAHCWPVNNDFQQGTETFNGVAMTVLYWEVTSMQTGGPVDVFELRDDERVVGRAHVYHDEDKSTLRELFIVPPLRRAGYGSFLEGLAVDRARHYEHGLLELWLHEDDARPRTRQAADAFGVARGYTWQDVGLRRPNVVAIGTKAVT